MDKTEFKSFCHEEFTKRGFKKRKSTYYLNSTHGLLCGLTLIGVYGSAYYIDCAFFIGSYNDPRSYPTQYEFDLYDRPFRVISKKTYKGEYFPTALMEYSKYSIEELRECFDKTFDNRIMPPILNGKQELIKTLDLWEFPPSFIKQKTEVLEKLGIATESLDFSVNQS